MWQVAVAAAVAGSGLIAKRIFSQNPNSNTSNSIQTEPNLGINQEQIFNNFPTNQFSPIKPFPQKNSNSSILSHGESGNASISTINEVEEEKRDGVFWFSSSGSGTTSGYCSNSRKMCNSSKKICRSNKKVGCFENGSVYQRKNGGKRVMICLKRRKTSRNSSKKYDSSLSKDCSSFGWGLGLGMYYMMSAGKAEINKLSSTIHETAEAVHKLQSELNKQKSMPCDQILSSDGNRNAINTMQKPVAEQVHLEACSLRKYPIETRVTSHLFDSDYASSVLTEEQQREGTEMEQLEAELESELQKLPWCTTEASEPITNLNNLAQMERHTVLNPLSRFYQSDGVHPEELKNKLSNLLIEQQESHICELESELNLAYLKLQEKEAELQALKDCVKRLSECSLSTVSGTLPNLTSTTSNYFPLTKRFQNSVLLSCLLS
ncbi:unnamed protein product [Amaranthus hypochondriacus]